MLRKDWQRVVDVIQEKNIKHISFDFWRTICFSNPVFKEKRSQLIKGFTNKTSKQIDDTFFTIGKKYNFEMEKNNMIISARDLNKLAFDCLGVPPKKQDEIFEEISLNFKIYPPIINPNFKKLLFILSKKDLTYSITSNTAFISGLTIKEFIDKSELEGVFKFSLFSDLIHCAKPHFPIYQEVLYCLGENIKKTNVLHVGDNKLSDYKGSCDYGFFGGLVEGCF
jgi:putative hydrolase of the HAD superfamily